jgi:VWFA-related protein
VNSLSLPKKDTAIMRRPLQNVIPLAALVLAAATSLLASPSAQSATGDKQEQGGFKFKSGVELINVTATVTDRSGRFYSRLRKEDFLIYEDNKPVEVTHFSADRTPVSLGIVVDSSGSMAGEKWATAVNSIDRFFRMMNDELDEFFLYRFSANADLVADWTNDRDRLANSLGRIHPNGGTAMYDAAAEAVPMANSGQNRKKAVVIISDGNDTSSRVGVGEVKQVVRETEVLVYAIGIDGNGQPTFQRPTPPVNNPPRLPIPIPFPGAGGRGGRGGGFPIPGTGGGYPPTGGGGGGRGGTYSIGGGADDRVNVMALREMTDDSGGRTEIVRDYRDLDPAVASIADELSQQYYLGYPSPGYKDGRWHTIRVELRDPNLKVRARKGYVATP